MNNLREIQALRRLSPHPNIISLIEVLYDQPTGRLALVFELMQRNIYELIRGRRHYLNETRVKSSLNSRESSSYARRSLGGNALG